MLRDIIAYLANVIWTVQLVNFERQRTIDKEEVYFVSIIDHDPA
jgi:hypothetical protein